MLCISGRAYGMWNWCLSWLCVQDKERKMLTAMCATSESVKMVRIPYTEGGNLMNMNVNIAGVEWKEPVTVASGTFGSGEEFSEFVDLNKLGYHDKRCS